MEHVFASRINRIEASATLKISAKASELKREGHSIISLSQGEPDFKTPDHICEAAISAIRDGHHGYTVNTGTPELREAITDKLKRDNGLDYGTDQIVVSNGAKQAIGFSILALVDSGDQVVIPSPYWVSYPEMVKLAGGEPVICSTSFENGYKLTPERLRQVLTDQTRALILCSPSNPTGSTYTREELKQLANVLADYPDIYILSDEIYEYITFNGDHAGIAQVAPELKERTVLFNGFSKGFAMTGWRLGYLAADRSVAQAVAKIQSQETSAASTISQKAGEAAYRGSMDEVHTMQEAFRKRRDYIVSELNSMEQVRCFLPGGAFYAFPDISAFLGMKTPDGSVLQTSTDLCLYLLEQHGLATVPGDAFGEPNGIRLSYATSMDDLQEAIRRLKSGLDMLDR